MAFQPLRLGLARELQVLLILPGVIAHIGLYRLLSTRLSPKLKIDRRNY